MVFCGARGYVTLHKKGATALAGRAQWSFLGKIVFYLMTLAVLVVPSVWVVTTMFMPLKGRLLLCPARL